MHIFCLDESIFVDLGMTEILWLIYSNICTNKIKMSPDNHLQSLIFYLNKNLNK